MTNHGTVSTTHERDQPGRPGPAAPDGAESLTTVVVRRTDVGDWQNEGPVLLFAAPWLKCSWPSLAIGTLKAHLLREGIGVRCCHLHLEVAVGVGWGHYEVVSQIWGVGESLFGALLDPDDADRLVDHAAATTWAAGHESAATWIEHEALADLGNAVESFLEREQPERYPIVGGSIGAMQLCSTLYLMKRIAERGHAGTRVIGGSGIVGPTAATVAERTGDLVDVVIEGEGEAALTDLVRSVIRDAANPRLVTPRPPITLTRDNRADLSDYFDDAGALGVPTTGLTLPFEHSRGCAWEHRSRDRLRGCTFCGLYRTSPDFRTRPVDAVVADIEGCIDRYRVLNLAFVDAYIPSEYRSELLDALNALHADLTYFTEMRCDLTWEDAKRLAQRANRIQLGVESFSTAILRHIGKGIDALRTIQSLRFCQELGVPLQYNLMLRIPGVGPDEVTDLANVLPSLYGLQPPNVVDFFLDRNSLAFAQPEEHGLDSADLDTGPHPWLPTALGDSRISQVVPFDRNGLAETEWQTVEAASHLWRQVWGRAHTNAGRAPLTWEDGGGWATIVDLRDGAAEIFTLDGFLYDVFTACQEIRSRRWLADHVVAATHVDTAIAVLVERRLVVQDRARVVSVAVRRRRTSP